ncbi:MAG: glycosyltransferase family 4 protein [Patescibacteria group bacterium]
MNILILNWRDVKHPKSGGAEIVTLEHAKAWVKAGHAVTWFTAGFNNERTEEFVSGVKIVRWAGSLTVYLVAPIYYVLHRKEFDIVVDEIHGIPFFTPLYVRVPIVAFIHEVAGDIWDSMYPFPINIVGRVLEIFYLRLYRNILFWADAHATIGDLVRHGVPKELCTAIPCPPLSRVLTKLPQKERVPTFLFVSRIVKMKGIEEVIRAFSLIYDELPTAQLWVVGTGEGAYVDSLKSILKSDHIRSRIKFFGFVSEEKKLMFMQKAHVLLHASVKEGWGLVVLESASQGTPAVVYDTHGLSEVVKHGKTGIVISDNSPETLAREAVWLYQHPDQYHEYQKNGIAWVKSLRWDVVTKKSLLLLTRAYAR